MAATIALLLALAALCAAADHAIAEASWAQIDSMLEGDRRRRLDRLLARHEHLALAAIIARATFEAGAMVALAGHLLEAGHSMWTVLLWALVLVVGLAEILPRLIVARSPERALLAMLPIVFTLTLPFQPLAAGLMHLGALLRSSSGEPALEEEQEAAEDILSAVTEGEREGHIHGDQADMIENIIELRDCDVAEIMTQRPDITFAALNSPLDETIHAAIESGHSRLPVYRGTRDQIVGILYVRDLVAALAAEGDEPTTIEKLIRPASFVPETMPISGLLRHFQKRETTLCIVVDEYGGTAGLVTIADITDLIVGEIRDQDDPPREPTVKVLTKHTLQADGRTPVRLLNDDFGADLPERDDYDTVGGYLLYAMGRVPRPGDRHKVDGTVIQVLGSDPRRVQSVRITVRRGLRIEE